MNSTSDALPGHYRSTVRTLLRFAVVATIVALLVGVAFQESSKRLSYADAAPGLRLEAILSLALVHGHVFVTAVLIPIAMAGALLLARRIGGSEVSPLVAAWLTRGYLPSVACTLALMLYKGYHVLLSVRHGEHDLGKIDADFFFGNVGLRHGVYGLVHVAMAVALSVFVIGIWRSLKSVPR